MAVRKSERPLQKVTLNLYEGDFDRIGQLIPSIPPSQAIREILRSYITKAELTLPIDLDLATLSPKEPAHV